jgi:hypothetical protein
MGSKTCLDARVALRARANPSPAPLLPECWLGRVSKPELRPQLAVCCVPRNAAATTLHACPGISWVL